MLEVKHVCYGIDGVPILKDISLGVQKGCIVTIVGPNGCGKSTLLKIISRILRPQSGEVLLDGCDVRTANTRSLARRMAILPQRKNVAVDGRTARTIWTLSPYRIWREADKTGH